MSCGWRWIRTTEGVSRQIYSLFHLATLESTRYYSFRPKVFAKIMVFSFLQMFSTLFRLTFSETSAKARLVKLLSCDRMHCEKSEEAAAPQRVAPSGETLAASGGAAASRCGADKLHRPSPSRTYPFAAVSLLVRYSETRHDGCFLRHFFIYAQDGFIYI